MSSRTPKSDSKLDRAAVASVEPRVDALCFNKPEPDTFGDHFLRQMIAKPAKTPMWRDIDRFPPKSRCCLSYQASLIPRIVHSSGMAGLRGPAVRYCF
jgi:hypothetical protein